MKGLKKFLSLFTAVILMMTSVVISSLTVSAAATVSMTPNGTTVDYTKTISVRIQITATEAIMNTEGIVTYDATQLEFLSAGGDYSNLIAAGQIKVYDEAFKDTDKTASYTIRFKALTTGEMTVSYSGAYVNWNAESTDIAQSITFTAGDPSLTNANLTALSISGGSISPRFSAETTSYNVTVKEDTKQITVNATAANGATVNGGGVLELKDGDSSHTITVTAKDGKTTKTYTLNIKRSTDDPEDEEQSEEPTVDVLQIDISDKSHHILDELTESVIAPNGFEQSTANYNGVDVPVFESKNKEYVLYNIKCDEDGTVDYYLYDSIRDEFVLLPYMKINGRMFIFASVDEDSSAPVGYTANNVNLGNSVVTVYSSEKTSMSDFCIIYCFVDGDYRFYSYDMLENTIQRAPDFKLITVSNTDVPFEEPKEPANWYEAYRKMPTAGKTVIFASLVAVLCIIALIVLVMIRAYKNRQYDFEGVAFEPDNEFDAFDNIEEINSFALNSEPAPTEQITVEAEENESTSPAENTDTAE